MQQWIWSPCFAVLMVVVTWLKVRRDEKKDQ